MKKSTRFVGLDVHKETIAVAEVGGEVRSLGTIPNDLDAVRRLVQSGPPVVDAAPDSVTDAKTDADAGCQHEFMVAAYGGPAYCVEADGAIVLIPRP